MLIKTHQCTMSLGLMIYQFGLHPSKYWWTRYNRSSCRFIMLAAWSQYVRNQKTHNIYSISSSMWRLSVYVILCFLIAYEPWCIEFTYSCCLVLFLLSNLINAAPHTHSVRVFCFSGLIICRLPCFLSCIYKINEWWRWNGPPEYNPHFIILSILVQYKEVWCA